MFNTLPRRGLFGARQPQPAPPEAPLAPVEVAATPPEPAHEIATQPLTASSEAVATAAATTRTEVVSSTELAAQLAARMCHDFISPAGAITSGLDLLEDPSASDMREEAMGLIQSSARKLVELLAFSRVAFGASASAESFDTRALQTLTQGVFAHVRPELIWSVALPSVNKAAARAMLNMAQLAGSALPTGGAATVTATMAGDNILVQVEARSQRVRLRPEVVSGLKGERLDGGLGGQWIQAFYLSALVREAGGVLEHHIAEDVMVLTARLPA
jgi:histidine phosphotransferase ChpT